MTNTKRSLDYWRKIFSCAKTDIFELIDKAILVAAVDYSNEFNDRKDQILEMLYAPQLSPNNGYTNPKEEKNPHPDNHLESQIVGEVMKIKDILFNNQNESDSILYDSLRTLQLLHLSVETLKATEIGRTVNVLRKHSSKQIQELARTLVNGWKELVDEWVKSAAANKLKEVSTIDNGNGYPSKLTSKQKPCSHFSEMKGKPSNSPQKNAEQSNETSDMSKLEISKRKLIEGYQRIEHAKKQRMIKIIDPRDLPMDSHEKGRRKRKS
ncbi:probable mediator of RNA polymerase II transcription subunit 26b [Dendrobium catenatum]|uniref:Putative mediator of RNA polymerase II transcription subunit 26a n=1 Tax=Dendrobium catenatum TaxID=906689 RepID=A0A2I0X1Q1_9ASPA|nr:probable mediator of RNA polymerase II transcription subunit 26b [Dendrobium catenatum]PKU81833.1 putative mediator of RNA polymerase II transcription subunit 26a [Dendrobium catenatum]